MDADNTIERCYEVTDETLHVVFGDLYRAGVKSRGNGPQAQHDHPRQEVRQKASLQQVAELTLRC